MRQTWEQALVSAFRMALKGNARRLIWFIDHCPSDTLKEKAWKKALEHNSWLRQMDGRAKAA